MFLPPCTALAEGFLDACCNGAWVEIELATDRVNREPANARIHFCQQSLSKPPAAV